MSLNGQSVRFGEFELTLKSAELSRNGDRVKLPDQPFQVLVALLEHPGEVVTRDELRHRLWPTDIYVDYERSLNAAIKRLREALGDEAATPRYIETLPRHGYRFIAKVKPAPEPIAGSRIRWLVPVVSTGIVLALLAGYAIWRHYSVPAIRSIVVLPLKNLSNDPQQDYFADGMTEALISELSRLEQLRVISLTSSMQLKNSTKPLRKVAEELDVDGVVEGSVLREGDQVRIRTRLIQARADRPIWSESFDRDIRDVLGLQAEVAHAIAGQIQIRLSEEQKARARGTRKVDPEVQEAFLKGRYFLMRGATGEGIKAFQAAIDKDPQYAPAYAGMAETLALHIPPEMIKAKEMASKALALDESLAEAHIALGTIYYIYDWNWAAAEKEYKRGLQLDPSSAEAHSQYGYYLVATGHPNEGEAEARQAQRLDPLALRMTINYGRVLYYNRRFDEAIAQFTQALDLDPRYPIAYMLRGYTKQAMGRYDEAFADFRSAWVITNNKQGLELLDGNTGHLEKMRALAQLFYFAVPSGKAQIASVAMQYAQAGDIDLAFKYLELAFQSHSRALVFFKVDPAFDNLRSDPRYNEMLKRLNLPE